MAKTPTTTFRISALEKQALAEFAEDCGMSVNAVIVKVLREVIGAGPHLLADDMEVVHDAAQQLAAMGRNLNQIVRAMNRNPGGNITVDSEYLTVVKDHVDQVAIAFGHVIDQQKIRWAPIRNAVAAAP